MNRGKARRRWSSLGSAALLAVVLSCSSGYDESVTADAGAEAGPDGPNLEASSDATTEGPCDLSRPFTSVAPVPGITGEVGAMSLTDDELDVIVAVPKADSTEADIVELTRAERGDAFAVDKVSGGYSQPSLAFPSGEGPYRATPTTTRDNLAMYFSDRLADTGTRLGVFRATRESTTSTFGPPTYVSELTEESGGSTVPVWLSGDRCRLYLLRSSSQGLYGAFVATRG